MSNTKTAFQQIGSDIKFINDKIGTLTSLNTTDKGSIVAAINEIKTTLSTSTTAGELQALETKITALENGMPALKTELTTTIDQKIQDSNTARDTQINTLIDQKDAALKTAIEAAYTQAITDAKTEVKEDILGGASDAYDTLKELEGYITTNQSTAASLASALNTRLRFDETSTLTTEQKANVLASLGLEDLNEDLLSAYTTARGLLA